MDKSYFTDVLCPISKSPCPGVCIYSDILENIQIGIVILDLKNEQVLLQNKLARDLLAYTAKPKDYQALHRLLLPDSMENLFTDTQCFAHTIRNGNQLLGYTVYNIIEGFICIFINDITEKMRLESIAEAVNLMENIGYIFSGVRHEIGNPINSIKITMSVLKKNLEKFSRENIEEYIDRVLTEISRVEYLLKSLRSFSMYESLQLQKVEVHSFIEKFITLVANDFNKKRIRLGIKINPEVEWVYTDPRALQHVLLNLLSNAADAVEGVDAPAINITVSKAEKRIKITVSDNGCGISEEEQKHLFKPFYTTKAGGSGLGLVIVKNMLARMNSIIEIKSRPGEGTSVYIYLPEK
ncbi:MAG: two-component system sensor histidine kinase NtrB [Candidatus Caldatribacteriaceae bacterium]